MKKRGMFLMVVAVLAGCATDVDVGPDTDWTAGRAEAADSLTTSAVMYQSFYQVPIGGSGPIQTAEIRRAVAGSGAEWPDLVGSEPSPPRAAPVPSTAPGRLARLRVPDTPHGAGSVGSPRDGEAGTSPNPASRREWPVPATTIRRVNGSDQFVTPDQSTDYFVQIELDPAGYVDGDLLNIRLHGHDTGTFVFGALFRTIPDDAMVTHMYGPDSTAWYQFRFTRPGIGLGSMEQIAPRTMMPH